MRPELRHLPNLITVCRILLVPPTLWLIAVGDFGAALACFVVAGVSDALDGALAKGFGWTSRLGGILDPIADKLLLVGCYLVLGWNGELPAWLVALVLLRDGVIVAGALAYHWLIEALQPAPSRISKVNTLMQLVMVFTVLVSHGIWSVPPELLRALVFATAFTTLWSGVDYVLAWSARARAYRGPRRD